SILLYFEKNFIVLSVYYSILLVIAIWTLYKWQKRRVLKKVKSF
ncbi:MAG: hypothetical protein RIS73_1167, partial [Bacteroidota bacterium]